MTTYKISIIGLGYVGLPLAVEFAKQYQTVGFDIYGKRVAELKKGIDRTLEIETEQLHDVLVTDKNENKGLFISDNIEDISHSNIYIITVPTPTDALNKPVFTHLITASETVGSVLKAGDIVIYESTVYPGVTEELCVPILEASSGLWGCSMMVLRISSSSIMVLSPSEQRSTRSPSWRVVSPSSTSISSVLPTARVRMFRAGWR